MSGANLRALDHNLIMIGLHVLESRRILGYCQPDAHGFSGCQHTLSGSQSFGSHNC